MPLVETIRAHVFAAARLHADDTTVPVLAKGKTRTGRLWTYVRDDRPFAGPEPPAAVFLYSRDHALFAIERGINGLTPQSRLDARDQHSRPLVIALEAWLREQRSRVSKNSETGKAIDYSLKRWAALTCFLDDGRLCMSNNAAERELRAVAVGRRNWTFAGSDQGGRRAAAIYTLIATAKLNDVDPQAWLADVLTRLPDHPAKRIDELLPWNWRQQNIAAQAA